MCNKNNNMELIKDYINYQTGEKLDLERVEGLADNAMLKVRPELWCLWNFENNNELGFDIWKMSKATRKRAHWICDKGHLWDTEIKEIARRGRGCPYCANQKIDNSNCLSSLNPKLASEWHPTKNNKSPRDVGAGAKYKVWWICDKGHEWEAQIYSRSHNGRGCPYCNRLYLCEENSLLSLYPNIAKEWHPTLNGELTPNNISSNNSKKVWWLGECGHEWEAKISNRTSLESKCPYCMNSFVLKGHNDMWTTNPELASKLLNKEDGYKYTIGTSVKLEWKCEQCDDTIRSKTPHSMMSDNCGCSNCSDGISYPEKIVYNLIRSKTDYFIYESSFSWSENKRYDFYIPSLSLIIEVHGNQHYKQSGRKGARTLEKEQENDRYKYEMAMENGISNYIVIDARKSNFEFIKESIVNSNLINLTSWDEINWDEIYINSQKSIIFEAIEMWNNGDSTTEIGHSLKKHKITIARFLARGNKMGLCDYNTKESTSRSWKYKSKLKQNNLIID